MSDQQDSSAPDTALRGMHNVLTLFDGLPVGNLSAFQYAQAPSWQLPVSIPASSSLGQRTSRISAPLVSRAASQRQNKSASDLGLATAQTITSFNTPSRSIFTSGPPTSSLSANTAQASMSGPPLNTSTHPLSTLAASSSTPSRRAARRQARTSILSPTPPLTQIEKEIDENSGSNGDSSWERPRGDRSSNTLCQPSMNSESASPAASLGTSSLQSQMGPQYTRASLSETRSLPNHLVARGLLSGKHSDITVHAFGIKYALHRLLLDRSPFFSSALSEPWCESSAKEIILHPEETDSNITQVAFEIALKHIYGCDSVEEEEKEAMGLLATGSWLDMTDLMDTSVNRLLRQMCPANVGHIVQVVSSKCYGKYGDLVLEAAKSLLCRDGYKMPSKYWDGIPGDILRETVGADAFFVPGEWERWLLIREIMDHRLLTIVNDAKPPCNGETISKIPVELLPSMTSHFNVAPRNAIVRNKDITHYSQWLALYDHPDISALMRIFDESIYYVHMGFEQLQRIRKQRDILGLPIVPEKVVQNALWMSMELRQTVVNAKGSAKVLGISRKLTSKEPQDPVSFHQDYESCLNAERELEDTYSDLQEDSYTVDGENKQPKFWVPQVDASYILGRRSPDVPAGKRAHHYDSSSYSSPYDGYLARPLNLADIAIISELSHSSQLPPVVGEPGPQVSYTKYPPFRCAFEFPPTRTLKTKKRVYSTTVWYAGNFWNVYVQKTEPPCGTEFGVFLHRESYETTKCIDGEIQRHDSVDDRIGEIERHMLRRLPGRRARQAQPQTATRHIQEDATSDSGADVDATLIGSVAQVPAPTPTPAPAPGRHHTTRLSGLLRLNHHRHQITIRAPSPIPPHREPRIPTPDSDDEAEPSPLAARIASLPVYTDTRPIIKVYFKIFTPSRQGRMISVYESTAMEINFTQSWGWKSASLALDDCLAGEESLKRKEGKMRFVFVIGEAFFFFFSGYIGWGVGDGG